VCNGDVVNEDNIELLREGDGMQVLSILIHSLVEPQEFDVFVAKIIDSCKSFIGAGGVYIAMLDKDGNDLEIVYQDRGKSTTVEAEEILMAVQGLRWNEYRHGIAGYCNDLSSSTLSNSLESLPFENILFVPLKFEGESRGVLTLLDKQGDFTDADAEMAINIGNILAIAMAGQSKNLPESMKDNSERNATEKALEMANRKLNLLGSATRHDILNQLMIIVGYEGIIEGLIEDERIIGYLKKQKDAVERVNRLLEFQRDYENMGTEIPTWTRASDIVYLAVSKLDMARVRIIVDLDGLDLFVDPLMEKVFYNLIHNSLEHGGTVSEIRIYKREEDGNLFLVYEDDGKGIPSRNKERIFEYGFGENTGQGLFLSREILKINDIEIQESGREGSGVRFEMMIPLTHFILANN
jgi:signal transduction histidine kinase